ncbi:MAG: hypothetical protein GY696_20645 [Gammaproteobacteria bacterium]|nr:hypothetical protein [Gammaproteobacteria bacterium]
MLRLSGWSGQSWQPGGDHNPGTWINPVGAVEAVHDQSSSRYWWRWEAVMGSMLLGPKLRHT